MITDDRSWGEAAILLGFNNSLEANKINYKNIIIISWALAGDNSDKWYLKLPRD